MKKENLDNLWENLKVNPYLTYAEIQAICNAVCKFDTWAERQTQIDMLVLHFATNITDEQIEEYGHEKLLTSGIVEQVRNGIKNFNSINEAISYTESTQRAVAQILNRMPEIASKLETIKAKDSKK